MKKHYSPSTLKNSTIVYKDEFHTKFWFLPVRNPFSLQHAILNGSWWTKNPLCLRMEGFGPL